MKMEERDEYGDPVGGLRFQRNRKQKIFHQTHLMSNILPNIRSKSRQTNDLWKSLARNERRFGKKGSTNLKILLSKPSQAAELSKKELMSIAKRGVKTKGVMEDVVTEKCWLVMRRKVGKLCLVRDIQTVLRNQKRIIF